MATYTDVDKFLQAIFPDYDKFARFARRTPAGIWKEARRFEELTDDGDAFLSIAAFASDSRRLVDQVLEVRCLVVDDVGELIPEVAVEMALGTPTAVVSSSAGSHHWWYRLSTPLSKEEWVPFIAGVQAKLGYKLHGSEAHHVFRMPMGTYSNPDPKKRDRLGFKPALIELPKVVFDVASITPIGPVAKASAPTTGEGAEIKLGLDDLRTCMSWLKNDEAFDERNGAYINVIGHGLKALCQDDVDGLTVFDEWSQPHYKYDPEKIRAAWVSFGKSRGLESKGGKLKGLWQAANPDEFARMFASKVFDTDPSEAAPAAASVLNFSIDQEKTSIELVKHFAGRIRQVGRDDWREFDPDTGRWREWTGNHMFRRVLELVNERKHKPLDPDVSKRLGSIKFIEQIARAAALHVSVMAKPTDFDRAPLLLGVPSGVIDLRKGASRAVRKGQASEMVSKAMWVDPAPAGTPHPEWSRFLSEFTQRDAALEEWLQVRAGYCLTGLMDEYIMPFYHGSGGNGKSVYLNALRSIWGEYGTQIEHRLLFEKQGGYHLAPLAVLAGVRLAVVTDVPQVASWDVHIMKMLTGDDAITANRMHQNPITFKSTAKVDVSGNGEPVVRDMDEGIRRRLKLIPCTATPTVIDKQLSRKLMDEWPAILRWALTGLDMYWALGGLPASKTVDDATREYHNMLDPFQRWLDVAVVKDLSPGAKVWAADLFRSWDAFRSAEGNHSIAPVNSAKLVRKMIDRGFVFGATGNKSLVRGYKLTKTEADSVF